MTACPLHAWYYHTGANADLLNPHCRVSRVRNHSCRKKWSHSWQLSSVSTLLQASSMTCITSKVEHCWSLALPAKSSKFCPSQAQRENSGNLMICSSVKRFFMSNLFVMADWALKVTCYSRWGRFRIWASTESTKATCFHRSDVSAEDPGPIWHSVLANERISRIAPNIWVQL